MRSFNHLIISMFVGSWVLCTLGAEAVAQPKQSGFTRISPVRSEWERRVLGRRERHDSAIRVASMQVPVESGLIEPIADSTDPVLSPDVAYDSLETLPLQQMACGDSCGDSCGIGGFDPCGGYYPGWWMRDLRLFAGVHGFKGPMDQGQNGNFGIHEGMNIGIPLGWKGLGFQAGVNAVQSNFEGFWSQQQAQQQFSAADRNQIFFTTGIFRRALCGGMQWGVAFDWLHDNYVSTSDLMQIRSETSLVRAGCREIGYYGAYGVGGDQIIGDRVIDGQLDPTDMFAFFYRSYLENGGEGRFWAGFTGRGDGLLGADAWVPMGRCWGLDARANYLIPKQARTDGGAQSEESWGMSIQLIWFLGQPAARANTSPFRPLFNVADNSLFMVDRL